MDNKEEVKPADMRKKLGRKAEKGARKYYKKLGFKILAKNYDVGFGEIDFTAKQKNLIVFVEVRSRTEPGFISPIETITLTKQKKIIKTALDFIKRFKLRDFNYRFDVVSVIFDAKTKIKTIEQIPGAFQPQNDKGFL